MFPALETPFEYIHSERIWVFYIKATIFAQDTYTDMVELHIWLKDLKK